MDDIKISSNKSFGIVFSIVFLLIAIYPLINNQELRVWSLVIATIFLILGLINSRALTPLNKLWFKFGLLLGSIIAPIIMTLIYFFTIFPTGLFMRLLGKDLLNKKLDKSSKSYWIERTDSMGTMKNQY